MAVLSDASRRRRALLVAGAIALTVGATTELLKSRASDRLGSEVAARARPGDIRMLSSLTCEYCLKARNWFSVHGVPFSECFIERDAACAAQFAEALAPGTPLLLVRGKRLIGFDAAAVNRALGG